MGRIIIEDVKINKISKKRIIPKEESHFSSRHYTVREFQKEEKREIEENEHRIDKYFNELSTENQIETKKKNFKRRGHFPFKKIIYIFLFLIFIGGGIYFIGNYFQKADITTTSKRQMINYENRQFVASKNVDEKGIDFEIMITSEKKPKKIILTDSKEASIKAKGSITLYNEFATTPQKLLAGTFVADEEGKTYKTDSVVTIPGYKLENKKIIPGQVVVNISAFLAGEAYNGSPLNFSITSFKGTPKYSKIYGKLNSPLAGGATGVMYFLSEKDLETIDKAAKVALKDYLLEKVKALVPPGYRLYPSAYSFSYELDKNFLTKNPEAGVDVTGSLAVVLLKEQSLIDNIVKVSLPGTPSNELKGIQIIDLANLSFDFANVGQTITKETDSFSFLLTGGLEVIWNPDLEKLKEKLLGISKNEVSSIFKEDPGIASAEVKLFPPWKSYLPNDINKIFILVNKTD